MFFFKKPKPFLRDLLGADYVDIHSHILFGIDDGAATFEDSKFLVESMMEFGTTAFITTPHTIFSVWDNSREDILSKEDDTKKLLTQNGIIVPFRTASEYLMDNNFVKQFQSEPLLTLKDNYVLVEMSYINAPIQLYNILFDLQVAGYTPLLAHPERYLFYHGNFDEYRKLKKAGCEFQINLLSVTGYYGEAVFQTAKRLLEAGMIDFAGSDAHHKNHIRAFSNKVGIKDTEALKAAIAHNKLFL
ncbi:tyrosine-protein phosphatase [Flavobacterium pallidum]|uniref:protein-tyrosine-phosphatase n=1 Tax=Flavobacterium pallidum TaxID=2172098 RepID=A0A2S1SDG5_9FLAO|nr:CpsB/CapC family capsule biosynthesis tyrosine phosphatase [Flavobacterium pallidum]AWI24435.1 histidinol phosphatase [Flavobacterium pallidum]